MKKRIFKDAWTYVRTGLFTNFSDALRAAWAKHKLLSSLERGVANFEYVKATGEIREAKGTLEGIKTRDIYPHVVKYWDLEKNAWRACRVDRLLAA